METQDVQNETIIEQKSTASLDGMYWMVIISSFIIFAAVLILLLSGCQYLPDICRTTENIETNDAITVTCDKDCFQKDTDVSVVVDIKNKSAETQLPQFTLQPVK